MSLEILRGEVVGVEICQRRNKVKMQFSEGLGGFKSREYGGLRWVGLTTPSFHTGGIVYGSVADIRYL